MSTQSDQNTGLGRSDLDSRRVGVRGLRYPIAVLDRSQRTQNTVADIDLYVDNPSAIDDAPVHRFIEVLNTVHGELTIRNLPRILSEVQRAFEAPIAGIEARFPYFMQKQAPTSGLRSLMEYPCRFSATLDGQEQTFLLGARIPVESAENPKTGSDGRVSLERSVIEVQLRSRDFVWLEDLIETVESCGSVPVYPLLTSKDEKALLDVAFSRPIPMQALGQSVVCALSQKWGTDMIHVRVESQSAMYDHQSFTEVTWLAEPTTNDESIKNLGLSLGDGDFSFGAWLRAERARLRLSQAGLAKAIGVTASFLSRMESDARAPTSALIDNLARMLGHDPLHVGLRAGLLPTDMVRKVQAKPELFQKLMNTL